MSVNKRTALLKLLDDEEIDPDELLKELLLEEERPRSRRSSAVYRDWIDLIMFHKIYEQEVNKKIEPIYEELRKLREEVEKKKEDPVEKQLRMKLYEKVLEFMDKFSSFAEAFINLLSPFSFSSEGSTNNKGENKVDVEIY